MATSILAHIEEPTTVARHAQPVTHGCPFPQGALTDPERVRLRTDGGDELPLATTILARWPDDSVKWLLLDTQVSVRPKQALSLRIDYGEDRPRQNWPTALRVTTTATGLRVDTGAVTVDLNGSGPVLIEQAGDLLATDGEPQMHLRDAAGTDYVGHVEHLEVEEQNRLRLVVRAAGDFRSSAGLRAMGWTARCYFYADQPWFKIYHTFVHDADEPELFQLRELRFGLDLQLQGTPNVLLGAPPGETSRGIDAGAVEGTVELWEYDLGRYSVFGLPAGRVDGNIKSHGWVAAADAERGVQLKLRHPGESYPKLYRMDGQRLEIHLYPDSGQHTAAEEGARSYADLSRTASADYDGPLQIPQGTARTHELFVHVGPPPADLTEAAERAAAWQQPLLLRIDSRAYEESGALGAFPRHYPGYYRLEEALRAASGSGMTGGGLHGLLGHGDTGLVSTEDGRQVTLTTDNVGYDHLRTIVRQWLRRGEQTLYWQAEAMAHHFMEVDVIHHTTVFPLRQGGPRPIWQQFHAYRNTERLEQSRPGTDHTWFGGLLDFYYITGYRRTLEVIEELGRYCARTRQRNPWDRMTPQLRDAWEDPRQSSGGSPRKAGWALTGMADLYEVHPDPELAEEMRAMVRIFASWQDADGAWRSQFGTFARGTMGFMVAAIVTGLLRTWELLGDELARDLCIKGCRYLATEAINVDGLMYYKQSAINQSGPCFSNLLNLRPMVFAYEQTGDRRILRCMWRLTRAALDAGLHSGHLVKDILWALPTFEREGLLARAWGDELESYTGAAAARQPD